MKLHEEDRPMPAVRRAITLPVPRERAWRAVTEELDSWLADEVELEPHEGGVVTVRWNDGSERTGVVEEVAEERRLSFRWGDGESEESLVELTLDDVDEGTRVTVLEAPVRALRDGTATLAAGQTSGDTPYRGQSGTFGALVGVFA
jgi:uncharacterized protein YndB with AHSA1/START domain